MNWLAKALVYATVLALPGHWIAPAYQSLLLAIAGILTGRTLIAPSDGAVDLSAANLLTILVALCLASSFVSWTQRLRALAVGLLGMVAIETATGILGMGLVQGPGSEASRVRPMITQLLELSRWLAVPLLWAILLGRHALRSAPGARSPAGRMTLTG